MSDTQDTRTQGWVPPQQAPRHDLVVTQDQPPANPLKTPLIIVAVFATVVALMAAAMGLLFVGERNDHADTKASLADVQQSLKETKGDLDDALDKVSGLTTEVSTLQSQLNGANSRAQNAQDEADAIQATADDLRECLTGVLQALDYSLDEDYISGAAELRGVQAVCKRAGDAMDTTGF